MVDAAYDPMAYTWRVLFVMALLFAVVFLLRARWGRERRGWQPGRQLRIVETLALGPQRYVHLIAVGDQQYLIGVTSQSVTFLHAVPAAEQHGMLPSGPRPDAAAGDHQRSDFPDLFHTAQTKARGGDGQE